MGAFIGRIGDNVGVKTRFWLLLGTFIQCLLTMAAAVSIWQSGQAEDLASAREEPSWTNAKTFVALGFMSASLGLQGIMAKRLNTQFTTTSCVFLHSLLRSPCSSSHNSRTDHCMGGTGHRPQPIRHPS